MDFKSFLIFGPRKHSEQEQNTHRIKKAKARNDWTGPDAPRFTEQDGQAAYEYISNKRPPNVFDFALWLEYLTRKRNHH